MEAGKKMWMSKRKGEKAMWIFVKLPRERD